MSQIITATFENGVFKPDDPPALAAGTKVRLVVDVRTDEALMDDPSTELDKLCEEVPIQTGGVRLTRDQLHERR
ncbi:MAG: antitoxin family protein [Gemmataceae bacterium]